ncbi:hypothetical protein EZS27_040102, partial [termite gut metagenome]
MKHYFNNKTEKRRIFLLFLCLFTVNVAIFAQSFTGEKTDWHGFDRYDFVINEITFQIEQIKATPQEGNGVKAPQPGTRRCIVV